MRGHSNIRRGGSGCLFRPPTTAPLPILLTRSSLSLTASPCRSSRLSQRSCREWATPRSRALPAVGASWRSVRQGRRQRPEAAAILPLLGLDCFACESSENNIFACCAHYDTSYGRVAAPHICARGAVARAAAAPPPVRMHHIRLSVPAPRARARPPRPPAHVVTSCHVIRIRAFLTYKLRALPLRYIQSSGRRTSGRFECVPATGVRMCVVVMGVMMRIGVYRYDCRAREARRDRAASAPRVRLSTKSGTCAPLLRWSRGR